MKENHPDKTHRRKGLLSFVFGIILFSFLGQACEQKLPQSHIPLIRLGHGLHDHHSPLYIAATHPELFAKDQISLKSIEDKKEYQLFLHDKLAARITIDSSTGGMELIRKLYEDQFDVAFGGVPAILTAIDAGEKIKIIAPSNAEGAGLVLRKDLPVSTFAEFIQYINQQQSPIRIGYKMETSVQNLIFESTLRHLNIPYGDDIADQNAKIILINLHGPQNLIPSLQAGVIDGFVINQPFVAQAVYAGVGKEIASLSSLPPEGQWRGNPCCAIAATESIIAAQPETINALTTMFLQANRFIQENPEEAALTISAWLGQKAEVERLSLPTIRFTTDLDGDWERGINIWVNSMLESKKFSGKIMESKAKGSTNQLIYAYQVYKQAKDTL